MKTIQWLAAWLLFVPMLGAQAAQSYTFRLQLGAEVANVQLPSTIGIRGSRAPLAWDKTLPMTDADGDGIYEVTVAFPDLPAGAWVEYKYIHDDNRWETTNNRVALYGRPTAIDRWNDPLPLRPEDFPPIPAAALRADFELACRAYTALHPGLLRHQTQAQLDAHFSRLAPAFSADTDYRSAYLRFSQLVAGIRCGHTYANFFNQSAVVQQLVFDQPDKLPLTFNLIDRRMIVADDLSGGANIRTGTEILAINGIPAGRILDSLLTVVKADGNNDGKRLYDLQVLGFGRFESFDVYFPLFFPPQNGQYTLDLRSPGQEAVNTIGVAAISRQERKARLAAQGKPEPTMDDLWTFRFINPQTAYLRLYTFTTWQMSFDWRVFLQQAFDQMARQGATDFILDIRGNEGGNDEVVLELAKYMAYKDVQLAESRTLTRFSAIPAELDPYLSSWDDSYRQLAARLKPVENGFYELKNREPSQMKAQRRAFQGRQWLLVDAANSSATFYLAKFVKDNQLATLVGQTTGGSRGGLNGGQTAFLRLPNSGIELDIPLLGTFFAEAAEGGVDPDISVPPTVEDLINGQDAALNAILQRINW
jgi:hypothetical protein